RRSGIVATAGTAAALNGLMDVIDGAAQAAPFSFDDDGAGHLRMDRAVVRVRSRLGEHRAVVIVGVERRRGFELAARAGDDVRFLVVVDPGHGRAGTAR